VRSTVELLLRYLHATVMSDLTHINRLNEVVRDSFMNLDVTAIRNLELVRNMADGGRRGTLLSVLDFTRTSMGARRLRSWIEEPLLDTDAFTSVSQRWRSWYGMSPCVRRWASSLRLSPIWSVLLAVSTLAARMRVIWSLCAARWRCCRS